ncbi:cytochrome bd-type quinol oxidase subunit 1 [Rhizobium pisi]
MDLTALLLSRIQFAFTVSFHIIFPAFTVALAAVLPRSPVAVDQESALSPPVRFLAQDLTRWHPDGTFVPTNWNAIIFSPVVWVRFPQMLLAANVTSAFCVDRAWHLLRREFRAESNAMLGMGLGLAAVLVPAQILFGHLVDDFTHNRQPAIAAIEGRWHHEQPAAEVLIAWPDEANERSRFEISIPYLGSLIASMSLTSREVGLTSFPVADPPLSRSPS